MKKLVQRHVVAPAFLFLPSAFILFGIQSSAPPSRGPGLGSGLGSGLGFLVWAGTELLLSARAVWALIKSTGISSAIKTQIERNLRIVITSLKASNKTFVRDWKRAFRRLVARRVQKL
jgi:hypothetical protein